MHQLRSHDDLKKINNLENLYMSVVKKVQDVKPNIIQTISDENSIEIIDWIIMGAKHPVPSNQLYC